MTDAEEPDELNNRRGEPRTRVYFPLICHIDDKDYLCQTIDLSPSGIRVRIPIPFTSGSLLRVSAVPQTGLVGRQRLLCRSIWVRDLGAEGTEVGTRFADTQENLASSWIQEAIQGFGLPHRTNRKHRRIPAKIYADLEDHQGKVLGRALCLNLSYGGALVHFDKTLAADDSVRLRLGPKGRELVLPAKVVERRTPSSFQNQLHSLYFLAVDLSQRSQLRSLLRTLLQLAAVEGNLVEEPVVRLKPVRLTPVVTDVVAEPEGAWPVSPSVLSRLPAPVPPSKPAPSRSPSVWGARTLPLMPADSGSPQPPSSQPSIEPLPPDPELPFQS